MDGRPVWLASVSLWSRRGGARQPRPVLTREWARKGKRRVDGVRRLERLLEGVGDRRRERLFRMNLTLCLHRALTDEEISQLPDWWHCAPAVHVAGGPVEVISERGCSSRPSTQPCESPGWVRLVPGSSVTIPVDCGRCPPCADRTEIARTGQAGPPAYLRRPHG